MVWAKFRCQAMCFVVLEKKSTKKSPLANAKNVRLTHPPPHPHTLHGRHKNVTSHEGRCHVCSPASHRVEGRCHVCYHHHHIALKVGVMYVITSITSC